MQIYLVGGAVRDSELGRPVTEKDYVVVGSTPAQMCDLGFQQVGKDFPVFLHPQSGEEYALARTERKTAPGYAGFAFNTDKTVTLEQDLLRRDLTINAIAKTESGQLIDPFGGLKDLQAGILRHVSPAFVEDPVRILRVARFMARFSELGFTIAAETLVLMREMVRHGEVKALVPERVWKEMEKALAEPQAHCFFQVLREVGALAIILPELDAIFGIPQAAAEHPEIDCGLHALYALQRAIHLGGDRATRFAALTANLGKAQTPPSQWPAHQDYVEATVSAIKTLAKRIKLPNDYHALAVLTARFQLLFANAKNLQSEQVINLFEKTDAFRRKERFHHFLQASLAHLACHPEDDLMNYSQSQRLQVQLKIASSVDIQAIIKAGHQGEAIQKALHQARVEALTKNRL